MIEPIQDRERGCGYGKKGGGDYSQDMELEGIQGQIDTAPEDLTEENLMETSASKPDDEDVGEAVPENRLTSDNLSEEFHLFHSLFHFFKDMDTSIMF